MAWVLACFGQWQHNGGALGHPGAPYVYHLVDGDWTLAFRGEMVKCFPASTYLDDTVSIS